MLLYFRHIGIDLAIGVETPIRLLERNVGFQSDQLIVHPHVLRADFFVSDSPVVRIQGS